jgi:hypothetical protein
MDLEFGPPDFDPAEIERASSPFHLLPCHKTHLVSCHKAHRIPVEIFSEIFLYTVQGDPRSQTNLMLVCRHWRDIMLSTPGIHSQLRIMWSTRKKDVERFGMRWFLDVTVDMTGADQWRQPVEFYACFMAAAEAASRWRSLVLVSFPPPEKYRDLQIMHHLQHLESFKLAASCNLGNFLEPLITAITTTVTPRFTVMEVFHPDAALYIAQPAHFQTFSSLTTLRLNWGRMQNPVDILPSLHKLEIFEAHHLPLPIYSLGVDLALTQTLRVLHLKSVSVQWIAGRIFPALEECSIIFPHHADAIRSVFMPSCSILRYDSNNLRALEHFHTLHLARLEVKCGQRRAWRGDLQLVALRCIFAGQALTCLHLEIKCSDRLLSYMLGHIPALEELWIGLPSPRALSSAFFLAFAAVGFNASTGPPSQTIAPLCRQLRKLHLHYKRWSRGSERNALIPAFGAIVASRPRENQKFSFRLSFGEGRESQEWIIHEPVERFDVELGSNRTFIGVSSPHGIIPLSIALLVDMGRYFLSKLENSPLPRESEYITTHEDLELPIQQFLSFHGLKEVRAGMLYLTMEPNTQLSPNTPLFHTLNVLSILSTPSPFLAGQTFHKLERYEEGNSDCSHNPGQNPLTDMPVCTRLVVPLSRLATLKLPQIRELGLHVDHRDFNYIWETHIAVNANLSGLRLLQLQATRGYVPLPIIEITKTLESLPTLKTLVLDRRCLVGPYVNFFEAFVPNGVPRPSGLNQASWANQISGVLCPGLESLQIEDIWLTEESKLMPVLNDIVTLRAIIGSPLKSFTFHQRNSETKWELVGRDGGFLMERVVPALKFQLDI